MEIKKYWHILWKRRAVIVYSMLFSVICTFLLVKLSPTLYESKAKLLIQSKAMQSQFVRSVPSSAGQLDFFNKDYSMGTIEEIFESSPVVQSVIREMGLKDSDGKYLKMDDFIDPSIVKLFFQGTGVEIENLEASEVFSVVGYSTQPVQAKEICEKIIMNFLSEFNKRYKNEIVQVQKVLGDRIVDVRGRLLHAEMALANFKASNQFYNTTTHVNTLIAEIEDLKSSIENNPTVTNYKSRLVELEANFAKSTVELTTEHPDLKAIGQQIEAVKENINKEIGSNEKLIQDRQKELEEVMDKERRANALLREVDNLKAVYASIQMDWEAAKSAEMIDLANAVVIQSPGSFSGSGGALYFPPEKPEVFYVVAGVLGLFIGVFFVYVLDYLDSSIQTSEDIWNTMQHEVIAALPSIKKLPATIGQETSSPFIAPIYNLFSLAKIMGKDTAAVAVVSDSMKDGRSTVASHIAFVKAQGGEKVVLVDGNLRSPSIHKIFNLSPAAGLSEYLLGERKMEEVITKTFIDNLDIITAGTASLAQPEHYLQSQRMTFLTKELMERYDFVIMDTPSFSSGTDAFIPATHMKKVLFVIRDGKNPQARVKECAERLGKAGIEITGVFLNGSRNGVPR